MADEMKIKMTVCEIGRQWETWVNAETIEEAAQKALQQVKTGQLQQQALKQRFVIMYDGRVTADTN